MTLMTHMTLMMLMQSAMLLWARPASWCGTWSGASTATTSRRWASTSWRRWCRRVTEGSVKIASCQRTAPAVLPTRCISMAANVIAASTTATLPQCHFTLHSLQTESADVTLSLWDLAGESSFLSMLPITVVDAVAVLFCFDLTQRSSLTSIREWYRQVRGLNKSALPFLVGE